jgi:hypothetical protein
MRSVTVLVALVGCASAMHDPRPISALAPHRTAGRSAKTLMRAGDDAWTRRREPGQAEIAQGLYLDAAAADESGTAGLLGALRTMSFRVEHESDAVRSRLVGEAVEIGQLCVRRAPADAECAYRLAIALGQHARERPSTGNDAVGKIVALLQRAIATSPKLDDGGPHRVLAFVLLLAPSWPLGPGDADAGLREARAAVAVAPDATDNVLVLGDALVATGESADAHLAYGKALALANAARGAGNPDAPQWIVAARAGLAKTATVEQ